MNLSQTAGGVSSSCGRTKKDVEECLASVRLRGVAVPRSAHLFFATMMDAPLLPLRDLREQPVMLKGRRTKAPVGSEAFCFVLAL